MKKWLFLLLLAGCGSTGEEDKNNHGYGFEYDVQGATGLKLRYAPTLQPSDAFSNPTYYETEFQRIQECAGINAPGPPFVIVVPGLFNAIGRYYSNPPLIVVADELIRPAFIHESIHYLLEYSTGDRDDQHQSPIGERCAPGYS